MPDELTKGCPPGGCTCRPPLAQRAYAKHRGVSHVAVGNAIRGNRLARSLNGDGKIVDIALADAEWTSNTSYAEAPVSVREQAARHEGRAATAGKAPPAPEGPEPPPLPDAVPPETQLTSNEVSRIKTFWQAKSAELEFRQDAGELVPAREVKAAMEDAFRTCRTKLLALPTRLRQRLPHLTLEDMAEIEAQMRNACEDLATVGDT